MKRFVLILSLICVALPSFGTTMCAINDSVSVVLDPSVGGDSGGTFDSNAGIWYATFSYGTIYGIAACLSTNNGKSMGGYVANLTDTNPDTNVTASVVGGERNGQYCWCKMTHPAASSWVFRCDYGSPSYCASNCVYRCGDSARNDSSLRAGLFGSAAQ